MADIFPASLHVRDAGLQEAEDNEIWEFATRHGYAIVTKDGDFRQRSFAFGPPPKVVWIGKGNCSTRAMAALIRSRAAELRAFAANAEEAFLAVF